FSWGRVDRRVPTLPRRPRRASRGPSSVGRSSDAPRDAPPIGWCVVLHDGSTDLARAARELAVRVPGTLSPLAKLAFNYWWSWASDGPDLFRRIDPERFEATNQNPVRLLREVPPPA